jgi:hypothetical protein
VVIVSLENILEEEALNVKEKKGMLVMLAITLNMNGFVGDINPFIQTIDIGQGELPMTDEISQEEWDKMQKQHRLR